MDEYVTSGQSTGNGHRNGEPQNETKISIIKKLHIHLQIVMVQHLYSYTNLLEWYNQNLRMEGENEEQAQM
jgi:hypothetical protein